MVVDEKSVRMVTVVICDSGISEITITKITIVSYGEGGNMVMVGVSTDIVYQTVLGGGTVTEHLRSDVNCVEVTNGVTTLINQISVIREVTFVDHYDHETNYTKAVNGVKLDVLGNVMAGIIVLNLMENLSNSTNRNSENKMIGVLISNFVSLGNGLEGLKIVRMVEENVVS